MEGWIIDRGTSGVRGIRLRVGQLRAAESLDQFYEPTDEVDERNDPIVSDPL